MLFLKQPSAAPSASRFASVLPLPPPSPTSSSSSSSSLCESDSQSERSSSAKSSLGTFDSNADSDSDESDRHRDDESGSAADEASDSSRRSSSSSAVSSALSFSSTTTSGSDDEEPSDLWAINADPNENDADPEAPSYFPLLHGRHRTRSAQSRVRDLFHHHTRQHNHVISMQAIRNADNLGFIALLIPITGIATMIATETLACTHHFDCAVNYPTLSYAATFTPEGRAFMVGMCLTALFILLSSGLFYWFLRLRLQLRDKSRCSVHETVTALVCFVAGIATAVTLAGLAIMDMRSYHDAHITFTVLFFVASWVLIVCCNLARRLVLLRERDTLSASPASSLSTALSSPRGVWLALKRWRRLSVPMAYTLGRLFILAGIASTVLFGLLFLCVNGSWPNPLGFTAVQEAFFEAFAIVCQLLFMGTLSCELSLLSREVEAHDYQELTHRE